MHPTRPYPFGYTRRMGTDNLLLQARKASGLSQTELARLAGTSRPTLSAYENGQKSPTLQTAARIAAAAGAHLRVEAAPAFRTVASSRGRSISVPTTLPRLPAHEALATITLPLHLNWSAPGRTLDLKDRRQRARLYEIVLREGQPHDVLKYVDEVLLVDLWDDLVLPPQVRDAWAPLIQATWRTARQ